MTNEERPLLFLDVDGPLLPFGKSAHVNPIPHTHLARLRPEVGRQLAALPCDLVWATTWNEDANTEIAPRLGLPQLPVVAWPDSSEDHQHEDQWFGLHWKTRTLVAWAASRPFIWIDDELTDSDREWVTTNHPGPALLHHVEPSRGLDNEDFTILQKWLHRPYPATTSQSKNPRNHDSTQETSS
ncbi:HAD domain-containing protein [Nocardia suismassiliense]|uniref:HAD domain-containing protein n=1 Tax=Nocardia suismassiliense TaxID=2077092 RepID=UPI000D1FC885|nr:HAD domain-containing protein [Nocardia suismassiliense]